MQAGEQIDQHVIGEITPQLIATSYEPVSAVLALLLGWRASTAAIRAAAEDLATNPKRRVLLLLVVSVLKDRNRLVAEEIAAMLPTDHAAVTWALGGTLDKVDNSTIADLGDHSACSEVLGYMKIKPDGAEPKRKRPSSRRGTGNGHR